MATQGGVAVSLAMYGVRLLFVGAHLAAHDGCVARRNADFHRIRTGLFSPGSMQASPSSASGSGSNHGAATAGVRQSMRRVLKPPGPGSVISSDDGQLEVVQLVPVRSGSINSNCDSCCDNGQGGGGAIDRGTASQQVARLRSASCPPGAAAPSLLVLAGRCNRVAPWPQPAVGQQHLVASEGAPVQQFAEPAQASLRSSEAGGAPDNGMDNSSSSGGSRGSNSGGNRGSSSGGSSGRRASSSGGRATELRAALSALSSSFTLSSTTRLRVCCGGGPRCSAVLSPGSGCDGMCGHDAVIWAGDLNYRVDGGGALVAALLRGPLAELLRANDQLRLQQRRGAVFQVLSVATLYTGALCPAFCSWGGIWDLSGTCWVSFIHIHTHARPIHHPRLRPPCPFSQGFQEGRLCFPPTFKYERGPRGRLSSSRVPSWTDRILWRAATSAAGVLSASYYTSVPEMHSSDHKPVVAGFTLVVTPEAAHMPCLMPSSTVLEQGLHSSGRHGRLSTWDCGMSNCTVM
jgi:hypothetical protein